MEVIDYQKPQSWSDKGMTWDASMNPVCIDYAVAIREAIYERCAVSGVSCNDLQSEKYAPIEYDFFTNVISILKTLAPHFYNLDFQEYKEDFSDFPKQWSWRDLNIIEDCRICEIPSVGCAATDMISWMINAKNYINKLTVSLCKIKGKAISASGSIHDPPFSESINTAISRAVESASESSFQGVLTTIYAWSGNTHYTHDPDGYCGYANLRSIRVEKLLTHTEINGSFIVAGYSYMDETPVDFSRILQSYVYDSAGTEFRQNQIMIRDYGVLDSIDIMIGCDVHSIPKNTSVPSSNWSDDPVVRRSKKRGYWANLFFLKNYGVSGGFKFRA